MFLLALLGICLSATISRLEEKDFNSSSPFLVFVHYQKPGFKCQTCLRYKEVLPKVKILVKELNFTENMSLGSRFLSNEFPILVYRKDKASYRIDIAEITPEELPDVINKSDFAKMKKVKSYWDVDSIAARGFSYINPLFHRIINILYFVMQYIPSYVVSAFFIAITLYLIYSIFEILTETEIKDKAL